MKIKQILKQDIDIDGNTDNFWVILDKINELVDAVNKLPQSPERKDK